ncbi:hypothetical protein [Streptomyces coffeae]|uniref:Lipocalin-like domain-containing protein n=1 Tax=Streptomyces coffeae TaxID=621382 RepID=A0ABS1NNY2_9ACTN|nr:hypothetical protein [Streptomyces coffeae]MBL1101602.1 hypothetical protein [Streptomyces coffeae]
MALLLLSGVTACSDSRSGGDTTNSGPPARTATPRDLVGAWESAQPGSNTTLAYRFTEEGKYKYFGMTSYPMGEKGTYELTYIAEGTYTASVNALTLRPRSASMTRKNPENPARDYTNRPTPVKTQHYRWKLADRKLSLTRQNGTRFVFTWVSR